MRWGQQQTQNLPRSPASITAAASPHLLRSRPWAPDGPRPGSSTTLTSLMASSFSVLMTAFSVVRESRRRVASTAPRGMNGRAQFRCTLDQAHLGFGVGVPHHKRGIPPASRSRRHVRHPAEAVELDVVACRCQFAASTRWARRSSAVSSKAASNAVTARPPEQCPTSASRSVHAGVRRFSISCRRWRRRPPAGGVWVVQQSSTR